MVLLRAKTYHKAGYRSCTLRPSNPGAKYQLAKFRHTQKAKFRDSFGLKSDTEVFTFTFLFLSFPLFSLFLPHFFPLAGHLVGFILVAKVFRKAFRILGLDERKGRWVTWNKIFMEIFRSMLHGFLPFSPGDLTELCSFWYGLKDLTLCTSWQTKLFLTVKTDDIKSGR